MNSFLWQLDNKKLRKTNLFLYSKFIEKNFNIKTNCDFNKIWKWSVENKEIFWKSIWDFTNVKGNLGNKIVEGSRIFYKNKFFPKTQLNYAENLLVKNDLTPAIIFKSENGYKTNLSWKNLNSDVVSVSQWMKLNGIQKGDRVAAYAPNIPETVIAYLSTATIGAIWSSCSPDFGTAGVIDRFSQISPKVLFIGDKYFYNGKTINILERLPKIIDKVPSITKVVVVSYPGTEPTKKIDSKIEFFHWKELMATNDKQKIEYTMGNLTIL